MSKLYKWALASFIFAFIMGWGAAHNTGDVQIFFTIASLVGVVFLVVFIMVGYIDGEQG
jgi:glutaminase